MRTTPDTPQVYLRLGSGADAFTTCRRYMPQLLQVITVADLIALSLASLNFVDLLCRKWTFGEAIQVGGNAPVAKEDVASTMSYVLTIGALVATLAMLTHAQRCILMESETLSGTQDGPKPNSERMNKSTFYTHQPTQMFMISAQSDDDLLENADPEDREDPDTMYWMEARPLDYLIVQARQDFKQILDEIMVLQENYRFPNQL